MVMRREPAETLQHRVHRLKRLDWYGKKSSVWGCGQVFIFIQPFLFSLRWIVCSLCSDSDIFPITKVRRMQSSSSSNSGFFLCRGQPDVPVVATPAAQYTRLIKHGSRGAFSPYEGENCAWVCSLCFSSAVQDSLASHTSQFRPIFVCLGTSDASSKPFLGVWEWKRGGLVVIGH